MVGLSYWMADVLSEERSIQVKPSVVSNDGEYRVYKLLALNNEGVNLFVTFKEQLNGEVIFVKSPEVLTKRTRRFSSVVETDSTSIVVGKRGTFTELMAEVEHIKDSRVDMVIEDGIPTKMMDISEEELIAHVEEVEAHVEEIEAHVEEVEAELTKRKKLEETKNEKNNMMTDEWVDNDELAESEESEVEEDYNCDEMHELVRNDRPQLEDDDDDDFVDPPPPRGAAAATTGIKKKLWTILTTLRKSCRGL
ncbi:unnamed protein product [Cochlearia groenlandica]